MSFIIWASMVVKRASCTSFSCSMYAGNSLMLSSGSPPTSVLANSSTLLQNLSVGFLARYGPRSTCTDFQLYFPSARTLSTTTGASWAAFIS